MHVFLDCSDNKNFQLEIWAGTLLWLQSKRIGNVGNPLIFCVFKKPPFKIENFSFVAVLFYG
jgi:hypothetical protein